MKSIYAKRKTEDTLIDIAICNEFDDAHSHRPHSVGDALSKVAAHNTGAGIKSALI